MDPILVKSAVSLIKRELVLKRGRKITWWANSREEALEIYKWLSPKERSLVQLGWQGNTPEEQRIL